MECIICGKTESDLEQIHKKAIEKLKILCDKRETLKDLIEKNKLEGIRESKNVNKKEMRRLNNEINEQNDLFFDIDISAEIIEKHLTKGQDGENNYKICHRCKSIIEDIVDEKIDELKEQIKEQIDDMEIDDIF